MKSFLLQKYSKLRAINYSSIFLLAWSSLAQSYINPFSAFKIIHISYNGNHLLFTLDQLLLGYLLYVSGQDYSYYQEYIKSSN